MKEEEQEATDRRKVELPQILGKIKAQNKPIEALHRELGDSNETLELLKLGERDGAFTLNAKVADASDTDHQGASQRISLDVDAYLGATTVQHLNGETCTEEEDTTETESDSNIALNHRIPEPYVELDVAEGQAKFFDEIKINESAVDAQNWVTAPQTYYVGEDSAEDTLDDSDDPDTAIILPGSSTDEKEAADGEGETVIDIQEKCREDVLSGHVLQGHASGAVAVGITALFNVPKFVMLIEGKQANYRKVLHKALFAMHAAYKGDGTELKHATESFESEFRKLHNLGDESPAAFLTAMFDEFAILDRATKFVYGDTTVCINTKWTGKYEERVPQDTDTKRQMTISLGRVVNLPVKHLPSTSIEDGITAVMVSEEEAADSIPSEHYSACHAEEHKTARTLLTTPVVLCIACLPTQQLVIEQTLRLPDFYGRPSVYQLQVLLKSCDGIHHAEVHAADGWTRYGEDITLLNRGDEPIEGTGTGFMIYQRVSPRPDDDGVSSDVVRSIAQDRPGPNVPVMQEPNYDGLNED